MGTTRPVRLAGAMCALLVMLAKVQSVAAHAGENHGTEGSGLSAIEVVAVAAVIAAAGLIYRSARRRAS